MANKSDTDWKQELTPEQYHVLREKGTEPAFSGSLLHNDETGIYICGGCGAKLFSSDHKFDSGSGWPSFYDVIDKANVKLVEDRSHGMQRVEIQCANCGGHLGHVFKDAPEQPTGMRFCVNSDSLIFKPKGENSD
jgi:peptide-methionine (R)-S-oxide reductase